METPLSPLEFARRARKVYGARQAVVDGPVRLTYAQFGERCDRWSAALAKLGVGQGDRVGSLSPNTHQHLEQFYAIPQLGAVIVPMNYRLTAEDFVYLANHSGCKVLCVHVDYLEAVDQVRDRMASVEHFVALEGARAGWLDYEALIGASGPDFPRPTIAETDLLSINYTSGTTAHPKGVMITHRNAWINSVGALAHWPMTPADRYLWTLPMFHANGWTFTWTVTAAGGTHVCLRKVEASAIYEEIAREGVTTLCAAPTVLIAIANGPEAERKRLKRGVRLLTAGAPPAAATIERIEGDLGWSVTQVYGLTETTPFIAICEPLPQHDQLSAAQRAVIKVFDLPITLKHRQGATIIEAPEMVNIAGRIDRALVRGVALAKSWADRLASAEAPSLKALALSESYCEHYAARLLPLAWLAPDLVELILAGRQPAAMSLSALTKQPLPVNWDDQRVLFERVGLRRRA